jgi:hypothetical protein
MYVFPSYDPDANRIGMAMLMHTASITFMFGWVSLEKYTVSDVFKQKAAIYIFMGN